MPHTGCGKKNPEGQFCLCPAFGPFFHSAQIDLRVKIQTTAALVDATLLNGGQLWTELAPYVAARLEAVHMRWLRKATGSFRAQSELRQSDHDVRVTFLVQSTWSLLRCLRLRYVSTFKKASPFLRALLQNSGVQSKWVQQIILDLQDLRDSTPKLHNLPPPLEDAEKLG